MTGESLDRLWRHVHVLDALQVESSQVIDLTCSRKRSRVKGGAIGLLKKPQLKGDMLVA